MKPGWLVHPRNLIAYGVLVAATVLTIRFGWTPWVVGTVLAAVLAVYYFGLPAIAMRGLPAFDAELRRLLVKGDPEKLLAFYRSHVMLRLFAPPGLMKHRLGQIHSARRVWSLAFQAYFEAMRSARVKDRYPLLYGYAEAGFHAGEDREIMPVLARIAKDPRSMGVASFMMVHLMVAGGAKPATIHRAMGDWRDRASGDAETAVLALAEAEVLALEGRRKAALERLDGLDRSALPGTIRPLALLLEAKIHHVQGRRKQASALFGRVREDPAGGRARLELREFLEQ